jgi:hypothetical protein
MSFFSIKDFIDSGKKSLRDKNYWAALSVALMLPSMCSRLTYADNEEYFKSDHLPRDKKCYIDWCNEYIKDSWIISCLGEKYAEVLYSLRCDIVHAGCADIYSDKKRVYLFLGDNCIATELTKYRIIDISTLCDVIFDCSDIWSTNFGDSKIKYNYVFDRRNHKDMSLYNKLCDEERIDYSKE